MSDWIYPDEAWEPLTYTLPKQDAFSRGDEVIEFAETFMTFSRGFKRGEPLIFSEWQKWLIRCMLEEGDDELLRFKRFILLLPRKNGKSLIGSAVVLHALVFSTPGDQIYSVARDRPQAKVVFEEVKEQVTRNAVLTSLIDVRRDYLKNKVTGAIYRALSSDAMSAQGYAPTLVVGDELHGWQNAKGRELYSAMTEGSADRRESLFIGISTAGASTESLLGELSAYGTKTSTLQAEGQEFDETFGFIYWGASEDEDPRGEETWKRANPNLAEGVMNIEDFRSSLSQAEATNMNSFLRYRLNMWVRNDGAETFLTAKQWSEAFAKTATPLKKGTRICIGFDGSVSNDTTGLVAIDVETGTLHVLGAWAKPEDDSSNEWTVPRYEVIAAIESAFAEFDVEMLYADPTFFRTDLEALAEKFPDRIKIIPQSRSRMAPMTNDFKLGITSGTIKHAGDKRLTAHALNAVLKNELLRKPAEKSPHKIDLLVCAVLAEGARQEVLAEKPVGHAFFF